MKILLVPFGSYGDVHPFVGLGIELKRRGHDVAMITNGHFRRTAEQVGLRFIETSSEADYIATLNDEVLWHPTKAFPYLMQRYVLPMVLPIFELLRAEYVAGSTIAVSGSLAFGARLAQEKLGLPLAVVHLQPSNLRSIYDPPVFPGIGRVPDWLPFFLRSALFRVLDALIDRVLVERLNRARADIGLQPVHRVFYQWWHSPQLTLGLFPDWFAPPQRDWPVSARLTGFPLYDAADTEPTPPDVLQHLQQEAAPIVFAAGSAMRVAPDFFRQSAQLCVKLKRPGLLLTKFPEQLPDPLPPNVRHAAYAPFSEVLPMAAAVVHHGGIGTTAQAFRAGTPQLIVPKSYDQPDNAHRVVRLGAGLTVSPSAYLTDQSEHTLARLISEPGWSKRCQAIAARFKGTAPLRDACDLIETLS